MYTEKFNCWKMLDFWRALDIYGEIELLRTGKKTNQSWQNRIFLILILIIIIIKKICMNKILKNFFKKSLVIIQFLSLRVSIIIMSLGIISAKNHLYNSTNYFIKNVTFYFLKWLLYYFPNYWSFITNHSVYTLCISNSCIVVNTFHIINHYNS